MEQVQGTLISKDFINLLLKYAVPATSQLVIVDSFTGDILYPYDASSYLGNAELGFVNVDGAFVYGGQYIFTPIEKHSVTQLFSDYSTAFDGDTRFTCSVIDGLVGSLKEDDSHKVKLSKMFDPSDPSDGGWKMEVVQIDASNDPSGPPIVHDITPLYQVGGAGKWWFGDFYYDEETGDVNFTLKIKTVLPYGVHAGYGGPTVYFRFTWDFAIRDRVEKLKSSKERAGVFISGLPRL